MQLVELRDGIDGLTLLLPGDAIGVADKEHGAALAAELDALEPAWQEARAPLPCRNGLGLPALADGRQHDEARQITALAAEAVVDPRTHRRSAGNRAARIEQRVRRIMVDLVRLHRSDDADVVGDRTQMRKARADLLATLPEARKRELRRQAGELLPLQLRDRLAIRKGGGHWLSMQVGQLRLVIERLQMRRAAGHVEMDHALYARRVV